ncbi:Sec34-domain-containing protein [Crepidotus variabilis]|uniref:Conserved oligomeric Golgi complex subunit 3 n=1 Tax=Crepidotus variabilis TaxID=179855 RepID=A0A9P6ECG6_9AGAR|nr:Sec34-domain-containing protein [Crepidotus variabilis]
MAGRNSNLNNNANSNRRGPTPSSLTVPSSQSPHLAPSPHVKQTISVEEWERKAPLSDLQLRSVEKVAKAGEIVPLPLKFVEDLDSRSNPSTPIPGRPTNKYLTQHVKDISRPGTPGSPGTPRGIVGGLPHALHPTHPVQTPQQFYDWFALIDRSVAHSQEAHYRAHLASLDSHLGVCDLLLQRIEEIETDVEGMLEGWRGVEEGGKSLKGACERLLEERDNLLALMEDIGSHLDYFQELEHATRMLNHPGESLIFQPDFHYMVERVDICIDFLKAHRHYREAEVYLLRFQQCMTRAMTLIKMNFVGSLRALSSEISKRIIENDVSSTAQHHLLYTRFRTVATKVGPLLAELERRAQAYPDELGSLLAECHSAYFSTRRSLLVPRIMEEIKGLDPGRSELVELTRSGCSYLKQLCTDEFNLYREFFSTAQGQLYQYLETLCDLLYDDLRPRILHEPRLTVLCEVCTVLQALMVLDATSTSSAHSAASSSATSSDDDEDDSDQESDEDESIGKRLHTGHLLKMVLQDAQTRLFFKAQAVVQSEIRHYVPSVEDLKWPDILVDASKPPSSALLQEKQSTSQIFQNVPALERQDLWYPTLRRTVWVLSQLRDFVKPAIFEDIAQEALGVCRVSLLNASDAIMAQQQQGREKVLDSALFLVRHLLILKEVLASLEFGGLSAPTLVGAGGGMTETLTNMFNRTTSLLPEGLFASLGVTRGPESDLRGVRIEIDQSLRKACEDVIAGAANPVSEPLEAWVVRAKSLRGEASSTRPVSTAAPPPTASREPIATAGANSQALEAHFLESLQRDLRSGVARVKLYLEDERTVKILLEHVVDRISDVYERFGDSMFTAKSSGAGSGEGLDILSSSRLKDMLKEACGDSGPGLLASSSS